MKRYFLVFTIGIMLSLTACGGSGGSSPKVTPDPPSIDVPEIDETVTTTMYAATSFLFTGEKPVQTGVTPETIDKTRICVIRGQVMETDGSPLPGVVISILNHPEYGQTVTRDDGMYDLAVNGGCYLTVNYNKNEYFTIQRQLNTPIQDYVVSDDVFMIKPDKKVETVYLGLSEEIQTVSGSNVVDTDGERQASLIIPSGTTAEMEMPDGSTVSIDEMNIRVTEYTVGETGQKSMPANLPPTVGYTYCVEYSVDEAIEDGAVNVKFDKTLYHYNQNFLNFPVGGIVPSGYYDRVRGVWVPSENGRVIKILSVDMYGRAELDVTGTGIAATQSELDALDITDEEREKLLGLYAIGESLWRVPIKHFTPWDFNWPTSPPRDAVSPKQPIPVSENNNVKDPNIACGSIIETQNQVLGESINITGTPLSLNYRNNRVEGQTASKILNISLSGNTIPGSLKLIELKIRIAGRQIIKEFPPAANQNYKFEWDGLDAYGRKVYGQQKARIEIGYIYNPQYLTPAQTGNSFGNAGGSTVISIQPRNGLEYNFNQVIEDESTCMGNFEAKSQGFGGWTLNIHHRYDPVCHEMNLGNGDIYYASNRNAIINTFAGNGTRGHNGDGGPAIEANMSLPGAITIGPDGCIYFGDNNTWIRKINNNGIITTIAGNGASEFSGDGGPATEAGFHMTGIAVAQDGSIYLSDFTNERIRKINTNGIITTIAGNGTGGFSGDGGPATEARFDQIQGISIGPDGSIYICDAGNSRIRKISTAGIITTVAGNGSRGFSGDGGLAVEASLDWPSAVAVASDGTMYIVDTDNHRIRKVSANGIITTIAGNGTGGFSGDGGPAIEASLYWPSAVAVASDGTMYIVDLGNLRIRMISTNDIITTVAGNGTGGFSGDGGPAAEASLSIGASQNPCFPGIVVGSDNNLYIADMHNNRIRFVKPMFPSYSGNEIIISSKDGTELYRFSPEGRHLETINAATGTSKYSFIYDKLLLTQIEDCDGNITSIERNSSGKPLAIVSQYGHRTSLSVDGNGYLSEVKNPADETIELSYDNGGLLTSLTDAEDNEYSFTYDNQGLLIKDQDPDGGYTSLQKYKTENGFSVVTQTADGRESTFNVENLSNGDILRTDQSCCGGSGTTLVKTNGSTVVTDPDGTVTTEIMGSDPRFSMQSPIVKELSIKTPSGLTYTANTTRTASLSDSKNLLSLVTQTDTSVINGLTFTTVYNAAAKTITTTSPSGRKIISTIDSNGRLIKSEVSGLAPVNYTYDSMGRLTSTAIGSGGEVRSTSITYDSSGNIFNLTDPLGNESFFTCDAAGRVTSENLPGSREYIFEYDKNGNVTSITPPGKPAHNFIYNVINLLVEYMPPSISGAVRTLYEYTLGKNVNKVTGPDGQETVYEYSFTGKLKSMETNLGVTGYTYDSASDQLTGITSPGGNQLQFTYDGSLLTGISRSGEINGSVSISYDNNFRIISSSVNGSNTINYTYDNDGLLTNAGSLTISRDSQNGLITGTVLSNINDSISYNMFGEVTSYNAANSGTSVFTRTYTRDRLGRIISVVEKIDNISTTYNYSYDNAGRLIGVNSGGLTSSYTYDANGNRLAHGQVSGTYDDQDRLISYGDFQYTYTQNGDLLTKKNTITSEVTSYNYDVSGNLRSVNLPDGRLIEYIIDGINRRIGKKINGVLVKGWLYSGGLTPVAETDAAGNITARFTSGYMIKNNLNYRIITDHLGSVRMVIDVESGAVTQRIDYDEFGNVLQNTNPGFQPFGFTGGIYDEDTGLVRFGARDYDPFTGRWTSKDPIRFGGGDANLYGYCLNDPVNCIDLQGLLRSSDYFSFSFGMSGTTHNYTLDRCGNLYSGTGFTTGIEPSISFTGGWINKWDKPSSSDLINSISGFSQSVSASNLVGGAVSGTPGNLSSVEVGLYSPGLSADISYTQTDKIGSINFKW